MTTQENNDTAMSIDDMAKMIDSSLFAQIAAMMVVCRSAKNLIDGVLEANDAGTIAMPETGAHLNALMGIMASNLSVIDFDHGQEIVAAALDACRMVQPHVDIICSGFAVGMPQKSKNPDKKMFIKGGIAANKAAIIWLDRDGAEQLLKAVTGTLDILHPHRLVGMNGAPLIVEN